MSTRTRFRHKMHRHLDHDDRALARALRHEITTLQALLELCSPRSRVEIHRKIGARAHALRRLLSPPRAA